MPLGCPGIISGPIGHDTLVFASSRQLVANAATGEMCIQAYAYRFGWDDGVMQIQKAVQPGCKDPLRDDHFSSIIDPNVTITDYYINVTDVALSANGVYPLATIRISGYAGAKESDKTFFNVQTSVSARIP